MKKLLSGNEALALGAYHAGIAVATAYPGTPSTEIMEAVARFKDIYAEWSVNEKVAMEVAMGACYDGARTLVSMKQVGLNVAADPFLAAATTGVNGGLVLIAADDPGIHSSQGEQDTRHFAELAKVPVLEPNDSQSAYDLMAYAFKISEQFDTPVILRSTTRISHSKSMADVKENSIAQRRKAHFSRNVQKYVMLPVNARIRHPLMEERLVKLIDYAETFPLNKIEPGKRSLGVIANGIAYQYAREVFPSASFLKLGMTYPLSEKLIKKFASQVDRILVVEELDPFLEEHIRAMGIEVSGKEFIPRVGELNIDIIESAGRKMGIIDTPVREKITATDGLARRPPLLCPGCPHSGLFYVLAGIGQRLKLPGSKDKTPKESGLTITGDIGCYTLGTYPPLNAMDTCACMGASIGHAIGMEKAGSPDKIVAIIGDSTFLHSGITPLVNAVYDQSKITVVILDNSTTAMTGHQNHPGTGISVQGQQVGKVVLEDLIKGIGVKDLKVVDAFNVKDVRAAVKDSLERQELSVIIVRGDCAVRVPKRDIPRKIDTEKCNQCGICLLIGCPAIQAEGKQPVIDTTMCTGCTICQQVCPKQAIGPC
ncbi:MAG: indolepyruvate ferredoxin oxidoreductase subunit alpha [Dehalococcoidales bacterium]|nr:indolepyruvate ferredoxin oxidoreductase subunit alpha [Dehalococcoidales bacterium]